MVGEANMTNKGTGNKLVDLNRQKGKDPGMPPVIFPNGDVTEGGP